MCPNPSCARLLAPGERCVCGGLRIGSLFTGTGALDMAAQSVVGGTVAWYSDVKPAAVALLAHRYPGVSNLGDITELFPVDRGPDLPLDAMDPARWLPVTVDIPPVHIVTFGWPCQPHSSAGLRLGEDDPRALLPHVVRGIAHLRPRILLGENVARVTTNGELRRAVRALAALGYVGTWRCGTAADEGAPHKRDRVALVAVRADALADTLGFLVRDEPGGGGRSGRAGSGVAGDDGAAGAAGLTLLPTPTVNDSRGGRNATAGRSNPDSQHHSGWTLSDVAYAGRIGDVTLLPTPRASDGKHGGPNMSTSSGGLTLPAEAVRSAASWGVYAAAIARWEHVLGRPAPDPTMPSPRTGGPHLSPWFVEWMMGLPAGWVCDVPDLAPRPSGWRNAALSLLGDGVVPCQLAAGFRHGLLALAERLERAA